MVTGLDVALTAMSYNGTPYAHQGRLPGVGLDCVGLVICVAHELELSTFDIRNYGPQPDSRQFRALLKEHLDEVTVIDVGCVLSFAFPVHQQHLAIATPGGLMVHSVRGFRVQEVTLGASWQSRLRGVYRFRGVDYG